VEYLKNDINTELFLKAVITKEEALFLKTFCKKNKLSLSKGVALCWSVKEAFFKCLDYDLKPGKISVVSVCKRGEVKINCSNEIKHLMIEKKIKFCFIKTTFDNKYIYSQAIMRKSASRNLGAE
jgi:phosphopantetheinyl transferase (holo-ACP synthase)